MKEILFELAGLWIVAIGGWMMHETGKNMSRVIGSAILFLALIGFSVTALINQDKPRNDSSPIIDHDPLMVVYRPSTVPPSTADDPPSMVYGSTIKGIYHRAGCRYLKAVQHPFKLTESAAKAEGKRPCTECLPP